MTAGYVTGWPYDDPDFQIFQYDAFGKPLYDATQDPSIANRLVFHSAGRDYDSFTKFQHNAAREYDPHLGRFVSMDPIGFAGGDTNLYRYVFNSYENGTDPTGEFAILTTLGLVALGSYLLKSGAEAAVETYIEYKIADYMQDDSFNGWSVFGRNFAVNVAVGWIPGAVEGKIAYKAGRLGAKIAGRLGYRAAFYASREGSEFLVATGVETGYETLVNGRDFGDSLLRASVGNAVGQGIFRPGLKGLGRGAAAFHRNFSVPRTASALPDLPSGYHYRSVGGRSVVVRNPGRAADLPQMHLDGNRLVQGPTRRGTGSYWDWANVRQRLGASGWAARGQDIHHWLIPRNRWGSSVPDVVKNQKWNLMRMSSRAEHFRVHGWSFDGQPGYNLLTRLWRGTPTPAKLSLAGGIIGVGAGYYYSGE